MEFGRKFENMLAIGQGFKTNRSIQETTEVLAWALLSTLPVEALDRLDPQLIKQNYDPEHAERTIELVLKQEAE